MAGFLSNDQGGAPGGVGTSTTSSAPAEGAGVAATNFNGENTEGDPNVTPEEQAEYDMFVKNAMELIYTPDDKVLPDVLKRLSIGKPADALAQTAVWVVTMVESSAKSSGKDITDDVIFHGGRELLEQLAEVQEKASGNTLTEKEMEGAWYMALDQYREAATQGGRFDPKEATDEFLSLNQADQEGRADDVLPGFSQLAHKTQMELAKKGDDPAGQQDDPSADPSQAPEFGRKA